MDLCAAIRQRLAEADESPALAYCGCWRSRSWVAQAAKALDALIGDAAAVGLVARNRPHHIATFAANLAARRATIMIHSAQAPAALARDILDLRLPAIVLDRQDWTAEAIAAAQEAGSIAIATDEASGGTISLLSGGSNARHCAPDPGTAMELLSSGTTGAPRRIPLSWATIAAVVEGAGAAYAGTGGSDAPQIMVHPLGNISGLAYALPPLVHARRLILLDRFEVRSWAEAVRDYKPVRGTVPPAGVRMLLDSDVPVEWLASLSLVAVGGGRLEPAIQAAFEARFGIPVLPAFGATEFGGVIANWSLDLYREWGARKQGSAGRASAGAQLRAIDPETGTLLPAGEIGLLEARVQRMGDDWIRTTDLAAIDADGFLFLHGRADGAINRGGFKIVPEVVVTALLGHPGVADAAVVGMPDARLGEVPVAAVEPGGGANLDPAALLAWLRDRLPAYQLPAAIRVVPALPRNASLKVALHEVRQLFGAD